MYQGSIRGPATARKASQRAGIFPCNARLWQAQSCSGSCTLARAPAVFIDRHASSNHGRPRAHCKSTICQFSGCQTHKDASIQARPDTHNCPFADVYCSPTTIATVPTSATPPVKATMPPVVRQPGGSQMQRSVATPSTRSTSSAVQHPSRVQQKGEVGFSPLVRGILIGIAAVVLLVAVGLLLLLKWLMPVKWVKVPPSGAAPWQRVRPTSLHGNVNSSSGSTQQLPTTDAFIPPARNSMPSLSSTTSQDEPVWGGDHR